MSSGLLLLVGIGVFALILGTVGCYLSSTFENAERKRRQELERWRLDREPWYGDSEGRTPTL